MTERILALFEEAEAGFSGQLSGAFYSFGTHETALWRAERVMASASLIKLPLLVLALLRVHEGRLELSRRHALTKDDQVGGNGVLKLLSPGLEPTLRDLLSLMIAVSDNTATNLLIELLGEAEVNRFLQAQGFARTKLVGKLQLPEARQNEAQRRGERNETTAADMLGLLLKLERRELLPPAETELALKMLRAQQFTEALGRYLPLDPELGPHLVLASKSGCLRGVWHDAGLAYRPDGAPSFALVVMTEGSQDRSFGWEQEGMMAIAKLGRDIFARVGGETTG